jgi:hypothetical protein
MKMSKLSVEIDDASPKNPMDIIPLRMSSGRGSKELLTKS